MNLYIPFICIAVGAAINWCGLPPKVLKIFDYMMNVALFVLMGIIGLNIGTSPEVMDNLGRIGINCLVISLCAIACSVALVRLCEATIMPLEKIRLQLAMEKNQTIETDENKKFDSLIVIMPGCIALGILAGKFLFPDISEKFLDNILTVSLFFLYLSAGITLGSNKEVFTYIKRLGLRVLIMPIAIFIGCIAGGAIIAPLLDVPLNVSIISATGMGYYSLTGAFLTETYGIEAGTYGFIVNVSRDVFTVALMPLLLKISKGSPVASGAGGCMDSMLVPVTRAVGPELGMVGLISGTIITIFVPIWLPLSQLIF